MFANPNQFQAYQNVKVPGYADQNSYQNFYGSRSEKSFDDLSKSSISAYGNRTVAENNKNFKVMVRVRPPLPRELEATHFLPTIKVNPDGKKVTIYEYYNIEMIDPAHLSEYAETTNMYTMHSFTFDHVFDQDSTQNQVYEITAQPAVMSVLQGYNATILAYGQTGTGKTFTMEGFKYTNQDPQRGIVPRCMEEIFRYIENGSNEKTTFMVRASYLQIYNEVISDLLRTERTNLHIREDKKKGVFVEGLSEWAVRSPSDIYSLIQKGALSRATASTKMNDVSSRSHAVFIIIVEQMVIAADDNDEGKEIRVGKLNLVDLAGSERVRVTGATGKRLEECKKINQSLSALGNVISALTDHRQPKTHIPYRDSKITRLLEDSLGGNCITTMMAMVSPVIEAFGESLSSLKFANRAKNIKNDPIINEDVDQRALLRKYEFELKKLRSELENRGKPTLDPLSVSKLEEDKRKAERDKFAAVQALEMRSREFMQEREEKKKLEEKIRALYSQVLHGGKKVEDTPQFRTALEEQQKLIRSQYEKRLQDLEKERQLIEEDKAQVDRYKQLLLKQRDIMIALTTRLNERDETIVQLQEELDAYDRIHRETEELLEVNNNRAFQLENLLKDNNIPIPQGLGGIESNNNILDRERSPNANMNKMYPQYNAEIVNYGEQEMYQVTQTNLLTGEEKIAELSQVANDQRQEITRLRSQLENIYNSADTSEFLKNEFNAMNEKVRQSEEEQLQLKEELAFKNNEIINLQRQQSSRNKDAPLSNTHKQIKFSLNNIIDSLSSQNEPQKLQNVARDLLNLQKLVGSLTGMEEPETQNRQQPSYSKPGTPSNQLEAMENKKVTPGHRYSASASRAQEERPNSNNVQNFARDQMRNSNPFNANYGPPTNGQQQQSDNYGSIASPDHRQSQNIYASHKVSNARTLSDTAPEENHVERQRPFVGGNGARMNELMPKKDAAQPSYKEAMGGFGGLEPNRRPMTVQEMLRLKKK